MSDPNLYRVGNAASPRYDNIRIGQDLFVVNDMVGPTSGGISTYSSKNAAWADNMTWVLQRTTPLATGLNLINNHGAHWLIAPSHQMTLSTYESHLRTLNAKAMQYDKLPKVDTLGAAARHWQVLAAQSAHRDRATRFVYNALASVVRGAVPVAGWDENDYEYVATLARELENGTLRLPALVWGPADGAGWSREKAFTTLAVSAYMSHSAAEAKASGNEDDEADAANDNQFLCVLLKLDDERNPFCASRTAPVV